MTQNILTEAFRDAAAQCGHALQTGEEYRIGTQVKAFPAVWLTTPELTRTEGIREGVKHYNAQFVVIEAGRNCTAEEKEAKWARMEADAAKICLLIGADPRIKTITGVKYRTGEFSITNKGEISLTVECTVQVPFYTAD